MRVAIIERRTIHKENENAAKRLHILAELLALKGHAVSFYCLKWWEGKDRETIVKGIRYYAVSEDPEDIEWRFAGQLPSKIRDYNPDIIISEGSERAVVIGAKLTSLLLRKPLVLDFHKEIDTGEKDKRKSKFVLGLADQIVVALSLIHI